MSTLIVIAVLDVQAQSFGRPMMYPAKGIALREIADEVNRADEKNVLYRHPADFRVFELGSWDEQTGLFTCHAQPLLLADCSSFAVKAPVL